VEKPRYPVTKQNLIDIFLLIQPCKGYKDNSNTTKVTTPKKTQEINYLITNSKEESHIHIVPPPTTKITGTNNHWSLISLKIQQSLVLISLKINGLNPNERQRLSDWVHK